MEILIKLNNQTSGRDKLARLLQYMAKSGWYYMQQNENISHKNIDKLKSLEYNLATFRKLLRFGRFVDHLYLALHNIGDNKHITKITATAAKLAYTAFLLYDHVIWIARIGIIDIDISKWTKSANRFWAITIALQLSLNIYEYFKIFNCKKDVDKISSLIEGMKWRQDLTLDTLKNICDIVIPLSGLGLLKVNSGVVGTFGTISSLAAILILLNPKFKFFIS
ncbi:hypothetical protein O3M35_004040 [Rhynocoris fuscipes]|uniref:Peroxisomal membrane protein 11B n=1 Tax=Rhynocoris fuscipes TaxID=488301 RepID=A0AAW1CNS6_9HEMI